VVEEKVNTHNMLYLPQTFYHPCQLALIMHLRLQEEINWLA
jgi:hypothetical protein